MVPEKHLSNGKPWYFNRPLGKNMLGEFLNKASELLNNNSTTSRSKVANHSARKTCLNTLINNDVNELHVSQLSGRKNLDSLNPIPGGLFLSSERRGGGGAFCPPPHAYKTSVTC